MPRLGRNKGRYEGERIEIQQVLREAGQLALRTGWERDTLLASAGVDLPAFRRTAPTARRQLYISAGIHGDEPAGPLAVLRLLQENAWPRDCSLWVVPCLNPTGFVRNSREDAAGIDLNRDYRSLQTDLVRAHVAWLERQPRFDVTLLLHEDWESDGFYVYELNPGRQPGFAEAIIRNVDMVCPIDRSPVIEGRAAEGGVICANPDLGRRPDWPEAFHLIHHKCSLSYTLEAPSDFPMETRVQALMAGVRAVLVKLDTAT